MTALARSSAITLASNRLSAVSSHLSMPAASGPTVAPTSGSFIGARLPEHESTRCAALCRGETTQWEDAPRCRMRTGHATVRRADDSRRGAGSARRRSPPKRLPKAVGVSVPVRYLGGPANVPSVPEQASRSQADYAVGQTRLSAGLALIRQRLESIFWTCKDLLTLERHWARTLACRQPSDRPPRATPAVAGETYDWRVPKDGSPWAA
jgi:hypothetical protein